MLVIKGVGGGSERASAGKPFESLSAEIGASLPNGTPPGTGNMLEQTEPATGEESRPDRTGDRAGNGTSLDPTLKAILDECPHLSLVSTPASSAFWDQVLGACEPYPTADGAWLGAKLRQWNQWFASHKSRRSRTREYLETRLMTWLTKDLEELARRPWA
jgi:hypothetical protein